MYCILPMMLLLKYMIEYLIVFCCDGWYSCIIYGVTDGLLCLVFINKLPQNYYNVHFSFIIWMKPFIVRNRSCIPDKVKTRSHLLSHLHQRADRKKAIIMQHGGTEGCCSGSDKQRNEESQQGTSTFYLSLWQ